MSLFRSQRERIVEQDRVQLKPKEVLAPTIVATRPPTPPQRSPLRNSPTKARASSVSLNPPNPENEDRSSTIWILYDEYNANRSDSEPSLESADAKKQAIDDDEDQQRDSEDSRRTSVTTISLSNFKRFLEQPDDSPYDINEMNDRLQKHLEKMANRRSWNLESVVDERVPEAKYSKVDQSEADRIRGLPTADERPRSPKKGYEPVSHDDEKDVASDRSQPSSATALPSSTPARRLVIPTTSQAEVQAGARPGPPTSDVPQKTKGGLEVSVPLRGESMVASLNDMFPPPPASQQPKTSNIHPPRSFIPDGARLPMQPSSPPLGTPPNKPLPTSTPPTQQTFLQHSPPTFTSPLAGSPPTFYNMQHNSPPKVVPIQNNMQQVSQPSASHTKVNSPPLPPLPIPQASYSASPKQNYMATIARNENQPSGVPIVVSPGSPPRVGPPPTIPRLAQLQVGQRLSPEEYRNIVSSNVLSSPETLVGSASDNDSATPYSGANRKNQEMPIGTTDPKWPARDPTVIKMQRRHAGIVGPSPYTPPDFLNKIKEEDITEQAPLSRKPGMTAPRPNSGGSDKDAKYSDESRGRSRVRDDDGTARVRSSHRESPPRLARGGLTINSGVTDYTSVKSKGQLKLGESRKTKRQELVRKRRRDVFVLKAAVLISVLNLLLVDALLIFWLVKGGAGTLFGKA